MTSTNEKIGSINVTPLIDILLVLLIIFVVIAPLASHGIPAHLPQDAIAGAVQPEPDIILQITQDHRFLLNGQSLPRNELPNEISKLFTNRVNHHLFINADRNLDYREVALAMDDARGADKSVRFAILSQK